MAAKELLSVSYTRKLWLHRPKIVETTRSELYPSKDGGLLTGTLKSLRDLIFMGRRELCSTSCSALGLNQTGHVLDVASTKFFCF